MNNLTLKRIADIDGKIVWINPMHVIEIRPYFVESSSCGTAVWLIDNRKVLVSDKPDIIAKTLMED